MDPPELACQAILEKSLTAPKQLRALHSRLTVGTCSGAPAETLTMAASAERASSPEASLSPRVSSGVASESHEPRRHAALAWWTLVSVIFPHPSRSLHWMTLRARCAQAAGGEPITQGRRQHVKGTEDFMDKTMFPQLSAAIVENAARSGKPMKTPLLMLNEIVIRQRLHLKCEYAMVRVTHSMP